MVTVLPRSITFDAGLDALLLIVVVVVVLALVVRDVEVVEVCNFSSQHLRPSSQKWPHAKPGVIRQAEYLRKLDLW